MTEGPLVLVADDELGIRRFLRVTLLARGYRVAEAATAGETIEKVATLRPDVVILDLGLPDRDGLEVTRELREWSGVPIVVLSARDKQEDKVRALDLGADDYLTKPFGTEELLARLRVAIRHAQMRPAEQPAVYRTGGLTVDLARRQVTIEEREIHLTPIEFKLLATLVLNAGKVVTHRHLLRQVWGPEYGDENHYVRVFMAQLRRKIEAEPARPRYIRTEPGVGYRLIEE
ncbi:MAG: response regulator [Acidobacteriota bacterium]